MRGGAVHRAGGADEVYPNCAWYVHKYDLVERSVYVPRKNASAPTPEWKRELREYLPEGDPARRE